jgi:hypothetical protein
MEHTLIIMQKQQCDYVNFNNACHLPDPNRVLKFMSAQYRKKKVHMHPFKSNIDPIYANKTHLIKFG